MQTPFFAIVFPIIFFPPKKKFCVFFFFFCFLPPPLLLCTTIERYPPCPLLTRSSPSVATSSLAGGESFFHQSSFPSWIEPSVCPPSQPGICASLEGLSELLPPSPSAHTKSVVHRLKDLLCVVHPPPPVLHCRQDRGFVRMPFLPNSLPGRGKKPSPISPPFFNPIFFFFSLSKRPPRPPSLSPNRSHDAQSRPPPPPNPGLLGGRHRLVVIPGALTLHHPRAGGPPPLLSFIFLAFWKSPLPFSTSFPRVA